MSEDKDIETLHKRIDKITDHFDQVIIKLNAIQTDVSLIKNNCKTRGETCGRKVIDLDKTIRGNGNHGLVTKVSALEQQNSGKEKFAYLIIGVLGTTLISVGVALISRLISS
jgi:hypothetical protein